MSNPVHRLAATVTAAATCVAAWGGIAAAAAPAGGRTASATALRGATAAPVAAPPPASTAGAPAAPVAFWAVRSLGVPDAEAREIEAALDAAAQRIGVAGKFTVLGGAEVKKRLAGPAEAGLAACDGSPDCVRRIAEACGAGGGTVAGQVGGLGGTYSVNLVLVAPSGAILRRSDGVLERGPAMAAAAEEIMARLLMPELHRGLVDLRVDIEGARVFVDGADVGTWPLAGPISVTVGKHAVRVTHSAYHDFVQFVEVPYRGSVRVEAALAAFPVLEGELTGRTGVAAARAPSRLPFYRTWWFVAGAGVVLLGMTAAIANVIAQPDYDWVVEVRRP